MKGYWGSAGAALMAIPYVLADGADVFTPTCPPSIRTTGVPSVLTSLSIATVTVLETIMVESFITEPHACYTHTETKTTFTQACPTYACPALPWCSGTTTIWSTLPAVDTCCPHTPTSTATVNGACGTCITGCLNRYVTSTVTNDIHVATPQPLAGGRKLAKKGAAALRRDDSSSVVEDTEVTASAVPMTVNPGGPMKACTTELLTNKPFELGPTKTLHPHIRTSTIAVHCGGCDLVVVNRGGIGPVAIFNTTVTDPAPTVTTTYVCEPSRYTTESF